MKYATIKWRDIADGPGIRVSLFVSGCRHHCKGCFNPETWPFDYGEDYSDAVRDSLLSGMEKSYIRGLSLLGGEPFEPENQPALIELTELVRSRFPDKTIWCYSGYTLETDILSGRLGENAPRLLRNLDVLVDGEFHLHEKNPALRFRGSENQRLIDVQRSLAAGETVLWNGAEEP